MQVNRKPFRYVQNIGTGGVIQMTWEPDNSAVIPIYLSQGEVMEMGYPCHARSTDTTAGVSLVGFIGIEQVGS